MVALSIDPQVSSLLAAARRRLWCDRVLGRLRRGALVALLLAVALAAVHVFVQAVPPVGLWILLATLGLAAFGLVLLSRPTLAGTSWWIDRHHGGMSWFSSWHEFGAVPPGRVGAHAVEALRARAAVALATARQSLAQWRPPGVARVLVCAAGCLASAWVVATLDGRAPGDPAVEPASAAAVAMPDADIVVGDAADSSDAMASTLGESAPTSAVKAAPESGPAGARPMAAVDPGEAEAGERRALSATAAAGGGEGRNAGAGIAAAMDGAGPPTRDPRELDVRLRELRAALGGEDADADSSAEFAPSRALVAEVTDNYDRQQQRLAQNVPAAAAVARPDDVLDAPARRLMNRYSRPKALP